MTRLIDMVDRIGAIDRHQDPEKLRAARVLVGMCVLVITLLPPVLVTALSLGSPSGTETVPFLFATHVLGLLLVRSGRVRLATLILCAAINGSVVWVGLQPNGFGFLVSPIMLVAPCMAMYLLGSRAGLVCNALLIVEIVGAYELNRAGWTLPGATLLATRDALLVQVAVQAAVLVGVLGWLHSTAHERSHLALAAAHATLQRSEASLLSLIDGNRDMVCLLDLDLVVVRSNAALRNFAHARNTTLDSGDSFVDQLPVERRQVWSERLALALSGQPVACDEVLMTGQGPRFLEQRCDPVLAPDGRTIGLTLLCRDVTDRKDAEARLISAQAQLQHAQKLQAIGTLSAGIAHELNNPLSVVIANLACIKDALDETQDSSSDLFELQNEAASAATRIKEIVSGIRAFSRADDVRPTAVNVERAIRRSVKIAEGELGGHGVMVLDLDEVPLVLASEEGLMQVLLNVLVNAAQALAQDSSAGRIRIGTRRATDGRVLIEVEDNGNGMTAEVRDRVFEPFFTTRPIGKGTGLGLPICHGIVTSLGGEIAVESAVGRGTLIRMLFPSVMT